MHARRGEHDRAAAMTVTCDARQHETLKGKAGRRSECGTITAAKPNCHALR